ncbi:MAG: hypothetical protein AAB152_17685 [Candidatus Coatesbacteria bacterium]
MTLWALIVAMLAVPVMRPILSECRARFFLVPYHPVPGYILENTLQSLVTISVFVVVLSACYWSGRAAIAWMVRPASRGAFRGWLAIPIGYGTISMVLLGLLLTGLWYSSVMVAVLLMIGVLPQVLRGRAAYGLWWCRRGLAVAIGEPWMRLAILVVVLLLPGILAPEMSDDAWEYFLAGPERWLLAHRFSCLSATAVMHYPALAELPYAFGLIAGSDAVSKMLNPGIFMCGILAVIASMPEKARIWGVILFATSSEAWLLAPSGKNEGMLTGFVLLIWSVARRRGLASLVLSGVLAGMALSVKYLAVIGVMWIPVCLLMGTPRRSWRWVFGWLAVALLVAIPWYIKTWILTGDPLYPHLGEFSPSLFGMDERAAMVLRRTMPQYPERYSVLSYVTTILSRENAVVAFAIPLILVRGGGNALVAVVSLLSALMVAAVFQVPQYQRWVFPSAAILLVLSAETIPVVLARWPFSRVLILGLALLSWFAATMGIARYINPVPYLIGAQDVRAYRRSVFGPLIGANERMSRLRDDRRGTLIVGEMMEYLFPKPCLMEVTHASAPFLWDATNASVTDRDLNRKFKQLNIGWMVHNPYLAMQRADTLASYPWTARQVALWREYFATYWDVQDVPLEADEDKGVYYIYRLRTRSTGVPVRLIMHLPGTESVVSAAFDRAVGVDGSASVGIFKNEVESLAPGVLQFMDSVGGVAIHAGDYGMAYRMFRPGVQHGLLDVWNLYRYGISAFHCGKIREALVSLEAAKLAYADRREMIVAMSARMIFCATVGGASESLAASMRLLDEGIQMVESADFRGRMGRERFLLHLARADVLRREGRVAEAIRECAQVAREPSAAWSVSLADLPSFLTEAAGEIRRSIR